MGYLYAMVLTENNSMKQSFSSSAYDTKTNEENEPKVSFDNKNEEEESRDTVQEEEIDSFWDDIFRTSQKLLLDARTKAEEIDEKYKIQDKARPYVQQVRTFSQSTMDLMKEQDIPTKAKSVSEEATKHARQLDDKYNIIDKATGAAVGIGAIQMATGHFKSGACSLAGAAIFAALGEKLKKDRENENELHLY